MNFIFFSIRNESLESVLKPNQTLFDPIKKEITDFEGQFMVTKVGEFLFFSKEFYL